MDQEEIQDLTSTTETLRFQYKNWKGEISDRSVIPIRVVVKRSIYHNDNIPFLIMLAYDQDKQAFRDFALSDILQYYDIL